MDKELIYQELAKIAGGEKGVALADLDVKYKNQFVDDGSVEFNKLRVKVIKALAVELYGADDIKEMKAVPQSLIDKRMEKMKKARQHLIEKDVKKMKHAKKIYDSTKGLVKAKKEFKEVDELASLLKTAHIDADQFLHNERFKLESKYDGEKAKPTYDDDVLAYANSLGNPKKPVIKGVGRSKRAPSAYNLFVKSYFHKHDGATMKQAAAAWNSHKK